MRGRGTKEAASDDEARRSAELFCARTNHEGGTTLRTVLSLDPTKVECLIFLSRVRIFSATVAFLFKQGILHTVGAYIQ